MEKEKIELQRLLNEKEETLKQIKIKTKNEINNNEKLKEELIILKNNYEFKTNWKYWDLNKLVNWLYYNININNNVNIQLPNKELIIKNMKKNNFKIKYLDKIEIYEIEKEWGFNQNVSKIIKNMIEKLTKNDLINDSNASDDENICNVLLASSQILQ